VPGLTTGWNQRSVSRGVRFVMYHSATKSLWSSQRTKSRR